MAFVRVRLDYVEAVGGRPDPAEQWLVDVKVDDGQHIQGRWTLFGVQGSASTTTFVPAVLGDDGRFDFGTDYERDADRYRRTNLRQRRMVAGELVTIWDGEDEYTYRVTSVAVLGEPSAHGA